MKQLLKIFIIFIALIFITNSSFADLPRYLDFKYVLNESESGKKAQNSLKKQYNDGVKKLSTLEKKLQEEEKQIIQQKKLISEEEYKKKISDLRTKVSKLQKERKKILDDVASQRAFARTELLKNLNPILKEYMV